MANSGKIPNNPIHLNPHGLAPESAPQAGLSRDGGGGFVSNPPHMPRGGKSEHGDAMQAKYKPGSTAVPMQSSKPGSAKSSDSNPHVSQPYDSDGDDWL